MLIYAVYLLCYRPIFGVAQKIPTKIFVNIFSENRHFSADFNGTKLIFFNQNRFTMTSPNYGTCKTQYYRKFIVL